MKYRTMSNADLDQGRQFRSKRLNKSKRDSGPLRLKKLQLRMEAWRGNNGSLEESPVKLAVG